MSNPEDPFILSSPILSTFILSSLILSNTCLSTLLCQVGFCQTLRSLSSWSPGLQTEIKPSISFTQSIDKVTGYDEKSKTIFKFREKAFNWILEMQMTALSAVWQMDFLLLPSEFKDFVAMVDFHNENVRSSRFSPFNYHQIKDKTNPRYHISNSWNNLPFLVKASQPDDFLEDLRCYFNSCNDQPCSVDKCWFCDEQ